MAQSTTGNILPVKRRRKVMNTCMFCRKRKLKCDHARPKCQQCEIRKLPECIYGNGFNFDVTMEDLMMKPSIGLLKDNAGRNSGDMNTPTNTSSSKDSPDDNLLKFEFLENQDGKFQRYGPTSWKTIVNYDKGAFEREYLDLWNVQKNKYDVWKTQHCIIENRPKYWVHFHDVNNILKIICSVLPTYEKTRDTLDKFFSGTLHDVYRIVDHKRTMDAFNMCFRVSRVDPSFENLLTDVFTDIQIPPDGNLYYIGIILLIVSHTMSNFNPDKSLTSFLEQLAFSPRFSDSFVERPQFLLLMYLLREYQSDLPIWETNQNHNLIMCVCHSCNILGLNKIDEWYGKSNYSSDVIYSLKRTFYWTMFFDAYVSFEAGKPLYLSDNHFDYSQLYNLERHDVERDKELRRSKVMTDFLKIVRPIVNDLNSTNFKDRKMLKVYTKQLVDYFESGLMFIKLYTGLDKLLPADTFDLPFVALGVALLLAMYHMRKKYFGEKSTEVNNGIIKYSLILISFCCKMTIWADQMDSFTDPTYHINKDTITHHLRLSILLTAPILKRVIFEFHDYFFQNLSVENLSSLQQLFDCKGTNQQIIPLDSFSVDDSYYYQIIPTLQQIENIEKSVLAPTEYKLHQRLQKSATFITLAASQMVSHILALQVIRLLKCSEDSQVIQQTGTELWNEYRKISSRLWRLNIFDLVLKKLSTKVTDDPNDPNEADTTEYPTLA
ncbi:similar to Saccharomyces cerevisiae YOR172W YRM1 Zn2-Cys6 zinc-finger transcription factor that activates genes involved in multidrug resistance [Maudiozyma saulgeensis]|uniref:Similar to Saccharomyces cerevisiae YOR172W YRM1 Zn2-Cys6 zinc-finger transcription factor that activates genes involved in multidrug resistance n=1 Tax=Maudiozyma saulgeensis TaxID=1789683 RepID=A0A1X7R6Z3_9SACH|nr:similar to Saccharomyces cerevisiae YOR172W YRM1 Zn2-Cys6 zinc-finger transcription factor that activates genes involved in multidrug resistance [Kazachstania saulgeensis]